jgi:hypothetical protein
MNIADIWEATRDLGPPGLLLGFMIWSKIGDNKLARERIAADLDMARAITLLTAKIDGYVR